MENRRTIKAGDVIQDVKDGMTDEEIADKYRITQEQLAGFVDRLVAAGLLVHPDTGASGPKPPIAQGFRDRRRLPRCHAVVVVRVYDMDDFIAEGYVRELTEDGLQASGLEVRPGDGKRLLIRFDEHSDIRPFQLEAVCRWTRWDEEEGLIAGFQITGITADCKTKLRDLLQHVTLCDRSD